MSVCTLSDVKDRLGIESSETDYDDSINIIIAGLVEMFNNKTNRKLIITDEAVTEYLSSYSHYLFLRRYPVVTITSIKEAYDFDFDSKTALVANTDFRLLKEGEKGLVARLYGTWPVGIPDSIQVVYRGGYTAAGQTPGDGETALPDDIREAAIEQASFIHKRRHDIGLQSQSFDGGSINKSAPMKLLPMVEDILKPHRRLEI